jgi:hypothetical protein
MLTMVGQEISAQHLVIGISQLHSLEVIQLLRVLLVLHLEQEQLGQNMKLQGLKTER